MAQFPSQASLGQPGREPLRAHFQAGALWGDRRFPKAFQVTASCQGRWRHPNCAHAQPPPGSPKNILHSKLLHCFGKHCSAVLHLSKQPGRVAAPEERHPGAKLLHRKQSPVEICPELCPRAAGGRLIPWSLAPLRGHCIPSPALWPCSACLWEKVMVKHSESLLLPWASGDAFEGRDLLSKWFPLKV